MGNSGPQHHKQKHSAAKHHKKISAVFVVGEDVGWMSGTGLGNTAKQSESV
jgi:hypothetical protein